MQRGNSKDSSKKSGSQNDCRKYGVIRQQTEAHVVRKMGVAEKDIVGASELNALLGHMAAGDTLCVPTLSSFAGGAYDLLCKMLFLSGRGIEFQSGNEHYLNFSSIRPLSAVTVETLKEFAAREVEFMEWINCSRLPDITKIPLINRIQAESLADITLVFKNNGIKKKGN